MKSKAILTIILIALLTPTVSAFEVGILKIDTPSRVMAGEQAEIKVTDLITGNPVSGADVQINGAKIGTTGSSGTLTYTFERGLYTITATKFGYTPAASLSLSVVVPDISTPTPTPTLTEKPLEEYTGLVFTGDLINQFYKDQILTIDTSKFGIADLDIHLSKYYKEPPIAFFISKDGYKALYTYEKLPGTGYYTIWGNGFGSTEFNGKTWELFNIRDFKQLSPEKVDNSNLINNPSNYAGKEITTTTPFRELSFKIEGNNLAPATIGSISTIPIDYKDFTRELIESGKKIQQDPDKNTIQELTKFTGVSTFRFNNVPVIEARTQAYWKAANVELTGFVIPVDIINMILPDDILSTLPDRGAVILLTNVNIPAERVELSSILADPDRYNGKVVEIPEIYTIAKDISVKELVAVAFPPAAVVPIDVYFEPVAAFKSLTTIDKTMLGFGLTGFEQGYTSSSDIIHLDGKYSLKGVVMSADLLNSTLPSIPVLVVFERYRYDIDDIPIDSSSSPAELFEMLSNTLTGNIMTEPYNTKDNFENSSTTGATLKSLTVTTPETISAKSGETINLNLGIDWEPQDWQGTADITIILSAAGFDTKYELPNIHLEKPPISNTFDYKLPDNLPPLTYTAKIIVDAGEIMAESSTDVETGNASIPGFESFLTIVVLLILARVRD